MISMVLQSRDSTPADVSGALMHLEPICAGMCAAREDRLTEVVPYLEAEIAAQSEQFDDIARYVPNARRFHEALVSRSCGGPASRWCWEFSLYGGRRTSPRCGATRPPRTRR
jgi:hypothetical protein